MKGNSLRFLNILFISFIAVSVLNYFISPDFKIVLESMQANALAAVSLDWALFAKVGTMVAGEATIVSYGISWASKKLVNIS